MTERELSRKLAEKKEKKPFIWQGCLPIQGGFICTHAGPRIQLREVKRVKGAK